MKIAKRDMDMRAAESELTRFLLDWEKKHRPTYGELVSFHARELSTLAKYMVRSERHPGDPDQPGGLEDPKRPTYVPLRFYGDVDEFVASLREHLPAEAIEALKKAL
jgi:hypothetical protein